MIELVNNKNHMVIKRNGQLEPYNPEKLKKVLKWAVKTNTGIPENITDSIVDEILENVNLKIYDKIKIQDLYETVIQTINNMITRLRPYFSKINRNLYLLKIIKESWGKKKYEYPHIKEVFERGVEAGVYDKQIIDSFNALELEELNNIIKPERDFTFRGYIEVKTYYTKYSLTDDYGIRFELPQIIALRQAIYSFWKEPKEIRLKLIKDLYDLHSKYIVSRSTPILSQSMIPKAQMASCVLINVGDSAESINAAANAGGLFSKYGGGIAFAMRYIRAIGSIVNKKGKSGGIIPFIRLIQAMIDAYDQLGTRKGAGIVYYDWWNLEIFELLELKEESGKEELRARNLQYAMIFNNILIKRALLNEKVTLFDPKEVVNLIEAKSEEEFEKWYNYYEKQDNIRKVKVDAIDILEEFFKQRYETGNIYEMFEENVQEQNMFKEKIYSSNLCVAGNTKITIKYNNMISDIEISQLQYFLNKYKNVEVLSYNTNSQRKEFKKITAFAQTSPKAKVIKITDKKTGKFIICTPDHKIWTKNRGYVEAKDLREDDEILIKENLTYKIKIEYLEEEIPVYDITVEDNHNFFANDILVHNCTEILIPSYPLKLHNDKVVIDLDGNVYIEGTKENPGEIGLCNLSSINIAEFMEMSDKEKYKTCYTLLRSMDNLLDYAFYPVKEAEISNKLRRSVGIGVFNYAYYLAKNKALPESDEAKELTFRAFEDLAYFLHKASIELAKERGRAPWFHKTKYADGILPQDLSKSPFKNKFEYKRNWDKIRKDYKSIGGRFSVLIAIAPTASSAIWSGATEGIEFPKDFIVQKTFNNIVEKQILPDLNKLGQYYKLAWDIDNKVIIELASIRQIFIDQSQSVSLYYTQEKGKYLSHKHLEDTIYAIKNGLKTLYYSYNKDEDQNKYKHCDSCQ